MFLVSRRPISNKLFCQQLIWKRTFFTNKNSSSSKFHRTSSSLSSSLSMMTNTTTTTTTKNALHILEQQNRFFFHYPHHYHKNFKCLSTISNVPPPPPISNDNEEKEKEEVTSLDKSIIRQIKADLNDADINHDGRIDSEELKQILKKYNAAFTDAEIVEISELFYTEKAGGSVSHERFIRAIEHAAATDAQKKKQLNDDGEGGAEGGAGGLDTPPPHFKTTDTTHPLGLNKVSLEFMYGKSHGLYTPEELDVKLTHVQPTSTLDKAAFQAVKAVRLVFDTATGWNRGHITTEKVLMRTIYLETIAAVPGMVAAIIRHFKSLRTMQRDGGMLNMFLEEANNERMHLLTFVGMKNPGLLFRFMVIAGQFGFGTFFLSAYIISPKFCHRFVGYVEEEACSTYTKIIKAIEDAPENNELAKWRKELAPPIARSYWHLGESGTVLDMFYAVRADEAEHRDVNHVVSGVPEGAVNPLYDPEAKLDEVLLKYVKDIMKRS